MFNQGTPIDYKLDEGVVVQVDPLRGYCKVKTSSGQTLHSVQWVSPYGSSTRAGDRFQPAMGDRVVISTGLGYPIILGFLPRLQTSEGSNPIVLNDGTSSIDTGNYCPDVGDFWGDKNRPKDILLGDKVVSTTSGNLLGLLRGGSVIMRASRGAEIVMSKIFDLIRVVARNWEVFHDVGAEAARNFKGRVYKYLGFAPTFLQSKTEDYKLHFYFGDTKAAEAIKSKFNTYSGTPAAADTVIYKEQVTEPASNSNVALMHRTLKLNGDQELWISNGTHITRVTNTAEQITISWNDQNTVIINESKIHAYHKDGADYIMDAQGIRATFHDGNINMSNSSIVTTFGPGTVTMNSTQIVSTLGGTTSTIDTSKGMIVNGAGTLHVSAAETKLVNGGHQVSVTSAGVAIT